MRSCEGCLVKGPAHGLDVSFSTRGGTAFRGRPHGVIGPRLALLPPNLAVPWLLMQFVVSVGQSFATPGLVRNGKKDLYPLRGSEGAVRSGGGG